MIFKRLLYALLPLLMFTGQAIAQAKQISGRVTNATGGPVANASVIVKGLNIGTSTDNDGRFSLSVPASAGTLVVTSIGFNAQEVRVTGETVNVSLGTAAAALNEVVVVGYGTQRRRDVTGAISKVTSEKITSIAAPSFEAALQGKAPGVQVIQGSGLAGSGSVIRIRGIGSISAGADPLYVVDGIPIISDVFIRTNSSAMNQNPLSAINPSDIESVEVLKDAAAAGIYGSRGSNGVILITTKRGKAGKPTFNYNNKIGLTTYAARPEFVNGTEWLQLRQEAWENDGNTGLAPLPAGMSWEQARKNNTDWWKELTRTGVIHEHNLSMSQGNRFMKSFIGGTFSDNESYLLNNSFTRMGLRSNFDFTFSQSLKVMVNAAYNRGINKRVPAAWDGGLGDAMSVALPIYPIYNNDGTYFTAGPNPVRKVNETRLRNTDNRFIGGLSVDYTVVPNLILRVAGSYDYVRGIEDRFETANWMNSTTRPGIAKRSVIDGHNWLASATATYLYEIGNDHRFNFLVGSEIQERKYVVFPYIEKDLPGAFYEGNKEVYENALDSLRNINQFRKTETNPETFTSFFGRINYVLKNKYVFQVLARVDGSSKFGPENKFGFFPSASLGWTLSEEDFMSGVSWINFLKLRTSYGLTGNSNIASSQYIATFDTSAFYYNMPAYYQRNVGDPGLHWEQTKNFDVGLEFAVFRSRLTGEIAYYNKQSTDILLSAGLAPSTGFSEQIRNIDGSKILNEGLELSLNARIVDKPDWKFSLGGNVARNFNELVSLGTLSADAAGGGTNDTRVAVGYPVGTNYVVRFYGVDPADGLPIWYDINGKLTKSYSLLNRVPVGSVIPDFVGGLNHSLSYKGFDFSSLWTFTIGGNLYDGSAKRQAGVVTDWNMRRDVLDRWRKPGDVTRFPRLTMNPAMYEGLSSEWQYNSTLFLYDASYMRLRELTIGYRLPDATTRRWGMSGARLFVTGMNLLTFTKYPGGDPEIARDFENVQDRNLSPNITYLTPPQQKSVVVGVNINF